MPAPAHIGIDEVGRGCVAGPVLVGFCAVYPSAPKDILDGIRDSKVLSPKRREEWYEILKDLEEGGHIALHTASQSASYIDKKGISEALTHCTRKGLREMRAAPDTLLFLDGSLKADEQYFNQHTIVKGDTKVNAISAAAIYAKVTRDREVSGYKEKYPDYGFEQHKGYGTQHHLQAIAQHGLTPHHRATFLTRYV